MRRNILFIACSMAMLWLAGCGGGSGPGTGSGSREQAAVQDSAAAAAPFDLMAYSALDTNSGVFHGEYDEKVNDEITVRVGLDVTLLDGKITAITLLDTAWVHPRAAELIPQRIIDEQRLPVDAVSGASVGSWSIMAATAIALEIDLTELEDQDSAGVSVDSSGPTKGN